MLASLEADLTIRADDSTTDWGRRLRDEYDRAMTKERTGLAWIEWRNGEVSQAAVAWVIASVFIRFAEDNGLLTGAELDGRRVAMPWIAAPGDGLERAVENETAFYATSPTMTSRDWLHQAFRTLAALPAGRPLVDPDHSPVWHAPISAMASDALLEFFRRTTPDGLLVHDFNDSELDTRFLGDLYQDLSDYAKKTYALLQTPDFIEEFILDLTLTPAIAEFGLAGLKLIDPACGSGHFLLGAFERLVHAWAASAPNVEVGERVQSALNSIYGVDLNPFAAAIARFRLTVAAIKAAGIRTLVAAPAFDYHLAIGDSLLGNVVPAPTFDLGDGEYFQYGSEDLREHSGILDSGQYHVVVANPPYIQVADPKLRAHYRDLYSTCHRKYQLSVPFMELLFRLAKRPTEGSGGYVGQITSNAFMKREFGKLLIEQFLSGGYFVTPQHEEIRVDLTHVIDTSGVPVPGHGTPTIMLVGRRRKPTTPNIRAALGIRGEARASADPSKGQVWSEISRHLTGPAFEGAYVSVVDLPREDFAAHPWSLSGGGAGSLKSRIEEASDRSVKSVALRLGFFGIIGADDAFIVPENVTANLSEPIAFRDLVVGDSVRDFQIRETIPAFFPYDEHHKLQPLERYPANARRVWPYRTELGNRPSFSGQTYFAEGRPWYEWHQLPLDADGHCFTISYAFQETHNHFVLDRESKAYGRTAPIIKLPAGATDDDHLGLVGVLNSSIACFWLKQVAFPRRLDGEMWETYFEFSSTKIEEYPLPKELPTEISRELDQFVRAMEKAAPKRYISSGKDELESARVRWDEARQLVTFLQEELDWQMYVATGLADDQLAPALQELVGIEPNERVFEIRLAREVAAGESETRWFVRHHRLPITSLPGHWPDWYGDLAERRLQAIDANPSLRILEQPEYKRRWAGATWEQLVAHAAADALLNRLEAPELWHDGRGAPLIRSAAQLADDLRRDDGFRELLRTYVGDQDFDLTAEIGRLLAVQAVPALAALRYKEPGIEKFRAWEGTWELQRAEDRREKVEVPLPPKYVQADFLKSAYWKARGKLDVPKERFISFPGSHLADDSSELYGLAGWDHGKRGQAVARLANDLSRSGAPEDQVIPLVGALLEIEPWLKQWHDGIDTRSGVSPANAVAGITTAVLARLDMGRDQVLEWRPPAATRGRRRTS